ncbi:glycosyltransferase [Demequina sp. SYSU T00039]|uniref:Glycosyltransferase n=1 Tax=Demequina lignilytica TaxID=3051663 RepID=A0AAW7M309_9MICO|nr:MULTISPECIES: glycosyltransferase [unclassified Demequina]MDN4477873.1 glycosyltransferase [Demequina sp. SYSU T00039-1]MDN4487782.1 glycosyltransferase [Demequina sp. SYSU T00039]MDN4490835.1 glycosyltransferase [Demequina sp. SYSU T00068]
MAESPFSLLLPVYRGDSARDFLTAYRSSTDEQSRRPDQVVIVRDGPVGDELADVLASVRREDPTITLVPLDTNIGLYGALERGLEASAHDIVARMDADDISLPGRFARQLSAMDAGLDLVGTGLYEFETDMDHVVGRRTPPVGDRIRATARFHQPFNHPTVVYRRSVVAAAGGYQPMGRMEDYWLFARMLMQGAKADNIPEPLLGYRVDAGAYRRRGGWDQFKSEIELQRAFRRIGFTTRTQELRNLAVRGAYRLMPTAVRRVVYRGAFGH